MKIKNIFSIFLQMFSLKSGHARTIKAKKNIVGTFFTNIGSMLIGMVMVPITIHYLSPTKYGIWITISTLIGWMGFFDIGLGNGLRNKVAEAIATSQMRLAKIFISTAYAILTLLIVFFLLLFIFVTKFIDWNQFLSIDVKYISRNELELVIYIVLIFTSISFIAEIIKAILNADQKNSIVSAIDFSGKLLSLILVYLLTLTTTGSLFNLSIVVSVSPLLVLVIISFWLFGGKYKEIKPSIKLIDFSKAKEIMSLGVKFFLIRISAIILYQTNAVIISHLFGPKEVTPYYVAFRYFSLLMMGYSIIISPFWSSFTEAWVKEDILWIKKTINKLLIIWSLFLFAAVFMLIFSKLVYYYWIGEDLSISFTLSLLISSWILLTTLGGIFGQFLNGVGKIKLQLIIALTSAIINIPLALLLGNSIGIEGVVLANCILGAITVWVFPLQYLKIINKSARGIWNE